MTLEDPLLRDDTVCNDLIRTQTIGKTYSTSSISTRTTSRGTTVLKAVEEVPSCTRSREGGVFGAGSTLSSVSLLISSAVGTGVLALPYAFKEVGPVLALILFASAGCIAVVTDYILFRVTCSSGCSTYGGLVGWVLSVWIEGRGALRLRGYIMSGFDMFMVLYQMASVSTYLVFLGDFIPMLLSGWVGVDKSNLIYSLTFMVVWPLSCTSKVSSLRAVSSVSFWAIAITAFVAMYKTPSIHNLVESGAPESSSDFGAQPAVSFTKIMHSLSICVFAFVNHVNAVSIAAEMRQQTPRRQATAVCSFGVLVVLVYSVLGFCVYYSFGDSTLPDFLQNYPKGDRMMDGCRVLLSCMLLVACPLNMFPAARALSDLLRKYGASSLMDGSYIGRACVIGVMVSLCGFCAVRVPDVASLIGVVSSFMSTPLMMTFPACMLLCWSRSFPSAKTSFLYRWRNVLAGTLCGVSLIMWAATIVNLLNK